MSSVAAAWKKLPWWVEPMTIVGVLTAFGVYSLAVVLFYPGSQGEYLSPFYSPEVGVPGWVPGFITAPLLILWIPLGFRATCYYYRKAYYRSFFWDPPACRADAQSFDRPWTKDKSAYGGERALFGLNNVHRYFLYGSIVVVAFLWYEAFLTVFTADGFQIAIGSLLWFVNIILVSAYTFSCHSFRHLVGGNMDCYSCSRGGNARRKTYNFVSRLNAKHPQWAWYSLFSLLATDVYLRLLRAGVITDFTIIPFGG
ncbi:MAG: succinate dehydrogenase [Rubrobacteraceae bacterium]